MQLIFQQSNLHFVQFALVKFYWKCNLNEITSTQRHAPERPLHKQTRPHSWLINYATLSRFQLSCGHGVELCCVTMNEVWVGTPHYIHVSEIEAKTDSATSRTRLKLWRRRVGGTPTSVEQRFKMHARQASAWALSAISCSININGPGIFNVIYEYVLKAMPP